jgi:hypothetical protein
VPGGAAALSRGRRQHRQHRLERRPHGAGLQRRLLRLQGRCREPHPGARGGVPRARRAGELRRAGRHRDASPEGLLHAPRGRRSEEAQQGADAVRQQ